LLRSRSGFSQRLKQIMAERGLTVTEVADRMRQNLPAGEGFLQPRISPITGRGALSPAMVI
jgi:hypothetical protein